MADVAIAPTGHRGPAAAPDPDLRLAFGPGFGSTVAMITVNGIAALRACRAADVVHGDRG
jgi:hypothetical protein